MGKVDERQLPMQQQRAQGTRNRLSCHGCSLVLARIGRHFSFKCFFVLILSLAVFLSAVFWLLPPRSTSHSGFDAKESIKLRATVQAYFRLLKPVSFLVPLIGRLEYDIYEETGVPSTKIAILSMHEAGGVSNHTDVVFGFLSDPVAVPINPVYLSVLRSSLIDVFLQQPNLTLTSAIFGQPYAFEILKFPGGITIIPGLSASIWQIHQILFNFTLYNSVYDIKQNIVELKEQLKLGLHLQPHENVFVQVTNKNGSTRDPPVTVQASVTSDLGSLSPQRLKQLAQTITRSSPTKNLGLDHSVFGKVKEISLSSYLNHTIYASSPIPSPAPSPSPGQDYYAEPSNPPFPAFSPLNPPAPSPGLHRIPPCYNCDALSPTDSSHPPAPSAGSGSAQLLPPISNSPAPSIGDNDPHYPTPHVISPSLSPSIQSRPTIPAFAPCASIHPPTLGPTSKSFSSPSPLPVKSCGLNRGLDTGNERGSELSPLAFSSAPQSRPLHKNFWRSCVVGLLAFHLLCWSFW